VQVDLWMRSRRTGLQPLNRPFAHSPKSSKAQLPHTVACTPNIRPRSQKSDGTTTHEPSPKPLEAQSEALSTLLAIITMESCMTPAQRAHIGIPKLHDNLTTITRLAAIVKTGDVQGSDVEFPYLSGVIGALTAMLENKQLSSTSGSDTVSRVDSPEFPHKVPRIRAIGLTRVSTARQAVSGLTVSNTRGVTLTGRQIEKPPKTEAGR
jgi:hypothetical protein